METLMAKVVEKDKNYFLELSLSENIQLIPLTEDKPNDVKQVFNELIIELKKKDFEFRLESCSNDLYSLICDEYIKQLNNELKSVRKELVEYDLIVNS